MSTLKLLIKIVLPCTLSLQAHALQCNRIYTEQGVLEKVLSAVRTFRDNRYLKSIRKEYLEDALRLQRKIKAYEEVIGVEKSLLEQNYSNRIQQIHFSRENLSKKYSPEQVQHGKLIFRALMENRFEEIRPSLNKELSSYKEVMEDIAIDAIIRLLSADVQEINVMTWQLRLLQEKDLLIGLAKDFSMTEIAQLGLEKLDFIEAQQKIRTEIQDIEIKLEQKRAEVAAVNRALDEAIELFGLDQDLLANRWMSFGFFNQEGRRLTTEDWKAELERIRLSIKKQMGPVQ